MKHDLVVFRQSSTLWFAVRVVPVHFFTKRVLTFRPIQCIFGNN
jgi:hypothetical protein